MDHDDQPTTDPYGGAGDTLHAESAEQRTAMIFSKLVREEMESQLKPVRSALGHISDEQRDHRTALGELTTKVGGLTDRVSALETRRQTLPLLLATAALVLGVAALGTVAMRPHVIVPVMMGGP